MAEEYLDELEQLYGTPSPQVAPVVQPEQPGFLRRALAAARFTPMGGLLAPFQNELEAIQTLITPVTQEEVIGGLRGVAEESGGLAGSLVGGKFGALAGASAAPFTFGASIPIGAALGAGLGYFGGKTGTQLTVDELTQDPTSVDARIAENYGDAATSTEIDLGIRAIPYVGQAFRALKKPVGSLLAKTIGTADKLEADKALANALNKMGVSEETALAAKEAKDKLVKLNPANKNLTTAQILQNPNLATTEQLLAKQPIAQANIVLADTQRAIVDDVAKEAKKLVEVFDPNKKIGGAQIQDLYRAARKSRAEKAGALFTEEIKSVKIPVKDMKGAVRDAKNVYKEFYSESPISNPQAKKILSEIFKYGRKAPAAKAPAGFGRVAETTEQAVEKLTVGKVQDWASKLSEIGRKTSDPKLRRFLNGRGGFVENLYKSVDATDAGEGLKLARNEWRKFADDFYRGPLKNIEKKSGEDVVKFVRGKSRESDAFNKIIGVENPQALNQEFSDFIKIGQGKDPVAAATAQLKWIEKKRPVYEGTPIWNTLKKAQDTLQRSLSTKNMMGTAPNAAVQNIENLGVKDKGILRALTGRGDTPQVPAGLTNRALAFITNQSIEKQAEKAANIAGSNLLNALKDPGEMANVFRRARLAEAIKPGVEAAQSRVALQNLITSQSSPKIAAGGAIARALLGQTGAAPVQLQPQISVPAELSDTSIADELEAMYDVGDELEAMFGEAPKKKEVSMIDSAIEQTGANVRPSLVKAVISQESSGRSDAVSPKGARGLMQLMPDTAKELGVDPNDPEQNVVGGVKYLDKMIKRFGNDELGLAAYNWGPDNIQKALKRLERLGVEPTWKNVVKYVSVPRETKNYVKQVLEKEVA